MHMNGSLGKGASGECKRLTDEYSREAAVKRVRVLICVISFSFSKFQYMLKCVDCGYPVQGYISN